MKYKDWEQFADDQVWFDRNIKGYRIGKRHTKNEYNSKIDLVLKDIRLKPK